MVADFNRFVPRPDLAYLLDADPEEARARKPEYPVDFMQKCRIAYFRLANMLEHITVIPPLPLPQAKAAVVMECDRVILRRELGLDVVADAVRGASAPAA